MKNLGNKMKIGITVVFMGFLSSLFMGDGKVDLLEMVQAGALVIDVRTADEFSGGHIQGAINIPYDVIARDIGTYESNKDRPIVVYCLSGARSSSAKKSLKKEGYTQVENGGSFRQMKKILSE